MSRKLLPRLIGTDLKQTILDVAEGLLATRGFPDFTMEELAHEIGIGKGTTYLHFPSKESVALGVIERSVSRVYRSLEQVAASGAPVDLRLRDMLIARVLLRHRNVAHYDRQKLAELLVILGPGLRQRRQQYSAQEIAIFARVIEEGIREGVFARDDTASIATAMFWATEGLLPSHVSGEELGEIAIAGRINVIARVLVAGITIPKAAPKRVGRKTRRTHTRVGLRLLGIPLLCGLLGMLNSAEAQTPVTERPLRKLTGARVDSIFARFAFDSTPGCAVGVDSGSHALLRNGYGMASLELHVPNSPSTVYYGASLAKQFTAAAILLLEQDGKLKLSDPVAKYIPELSTAAYGVTLEQLLEHTSGMRDYPDLLLMGGREEGGVDISEILNLQRRQRSSNFPPGTDFAYNNGGYVLLAEVVRRASGLALPEFARRRIFLPLRMAHTQFVASHAQLVENRAVGHRVTGSQWQIAPYLEDSYGDGGLFTTVGDLLIWAQSFKTGMVGAPGLSERLAKETILPGGRHTGFGLGLEVSVYRGHEFVGHGGRSSGAQNYAMTFLADGISIAVLCNARDTDAELFARRIAGSIFSPLPASVGHVDTSRIDVDLLAIRAVEGLYFNPQTLATRKVEVRGRQLVWARGDGTVLVPQSTTRFRFPDQAAALVFSDFRDRRARRMSIVPDIGDPTVYERAEPFVMPAAGLAEYSGFYSSDEVGGSYEVAASDSAISFQSASSSFSFIAFPVMKEAFKGGDDVLLTFQRNRKGKIIGFAFNTSRARNVAFVRRR